MNTELFLSRLSLYMVQAGLALSLAMILWHFYRVYARHYLKSWSLAFMTYAAYLVLVTVNANMGTYLPDDPIARPLVEFSFILCSYSFAIFMLVGVREAVLGERLSSRLVNQLLGLVTVLALGSVALFASDPAPSVWKSALQINLRLLFIGAALFVSGVWLYALPRRLFITRLVAISVMCWGGQLMLMALFVSWFGDSQLYERITMVAKHFEVLFMMLLGIGLLVWLQEDERIANQALTAKTHYLDTHDHLTGALNRDAFLQESHQLLQRDSGTFMVVMLGLDRFKTINETVGLKQGDRILREVSRRLETSILKPRLLGRTGGDIFALLLDDVSSEKQRQICLQHIEQLVEKQFSFDTGPLKLTATLGVARYPAHAESAESLLQKANIAFHHAKRMQQRWFLYHPGMEDESARMLQLEQELQQAMQQREFVLFFQPQWNIREQRIDGFEALVRWQHPSKGLLMPGAFLPHMEQLGLMKALDLMLLEVAVETLGRWKKQGLRLSLAVNMTPIHFEQEGLKQRIQQLLQTYDVPPTMLELEITENTAMGDMEKGLNIVTELQQMGIRVSIDDFGTGYSSLGYLRKMPIDKIKIDRSFIIDMAGSDSDMMIVKTMITLAHGLGKRILAEGVEDANQLQLLRHLACDAVQGYLISKPVPEPQALALLQNPPSF